eukprot:4792825-Pyramimonas_sp.AAC.1
MFLYEQSLAVDNTAFNSNSMPSSTSSIQLPSSEVLLDMGYQYHVFLSHDRSTDEKGRSNHERAAAVNAALRKRNVITWFDNEVEGSEEGIVEGVDKSLCTVVLVTFTYGVKTGGDDTRGSPFGWRPTPPGDSSWLEWQLARQYQGQEHMIPVIMEPRMANPAGWKTSHWVTEGGMMYKVNLGDVQANDQDDAFNEQMDLLAKEIVSVCDMRVRSHPAEALRRLKRTDI